MRNILILTLILINFSFCANSQSNSQKEYKRVRTAYEDKENFVKNLLSENGIKNYEYDLLITAYKTEQFLQVWCKPKDSTTYKPLIKYDFCTSSGVLGPKRQSGDFQIPEGFYHISYFNPASSYYLSLKVSYPNKSDKILGVKDKLGGDIFIHGACCSIGCIPITDDKIKELYILCLEAKNSGQSEIPVYIFPAQLERNKFIKLKKQHIENKELIEFWANLKTGYDLFKTTKKEVSFSIDNKGKYIFKEN